MATVTLIPTAYWQVEGNTVTAKNPEIKHVTSNSTKRIIVEFNIPKTAAYAHAIVSYNTIKNMTSVPQGQYDALTPRYYGGQYCMVTNLTNISLGTDVSDIKYKTLFSGDVWFNADGSYSSSSLALSNVAKGLTTNKLYLLIRTYNSSEGYANLHMKNMTLELTYTTSSSNFVVTKNPNSGFLNPIKTNKFTFEVTPKEELLTQYDIASGTFYYKLSSASSYTSVNFTGSTYTLPANTLTAGNTYNIYATLKSSDNTSKNTSTTNYNTNDATPTVTPISPNNEVIKGSALFKWSYSVSTGMQQYAYQIQGSTDGSTWTNLKSKTVSSANSVTLNISNVGTNYWRIRAYNQSDVASAWSSAVMYINVLPPTTPTIISLNAGGRPDITWSASNQMAYQVQVVSNNEIIIDSGYVYSSDTNYKVLEYLEDGIYTFKVRIMNQYGVSNWATIDYSQNYGLIAPEYTVENTDEGVHITIAENNDYQKYYLRRNGDLIGKFDGREYTDRFAIGEIDYEIIFVTGDDTAVKVQFKHIYKSEHTMLVGKDGTVYAIHKRWNDEIIPQSTREIENDYVYFLGEKKPQINVTRMRTNKYTVAVCELDFALDKLLGQTLFFKTPHGIGGWVVLLSTNRTDKWFGNDTVCNLGETRYLDEVITYDL